MLPPISNRTRPTPAGSLKRALAVLLPLIGTALPHLAAAHGFLQERIGEMDRLIAANPNWTEPYLRRALLSVPPR